MLETVNRYLRHVADRNGLDWLKLDTKGVCGAHTKEGNKWQLEVQPGSPWMLFFAEVGEIPTQDQRRLNWYENMQALNFPGPESLLGTLSLKPGSRFCYLHYWQEIASLDAPKLEKLLNRFLTDISRAKRGLDMAFSVKDPISGGSRSSIRKAYSAPVNLPYLNETKRF